ncbi:hypothetical protein [Malikia granosa]|uniref:Uncharacterized protein n=1 Tax=Malikia granosa TaxID=263067 RepID=A0A2S9K190_9BURK|nr:hypothetical protein [Malikia granosa]PRD64147.1 hypothetical protein C6P64_15910 [Malikia granosa]
MADPLLLPLDVVPRHSYSFLWADYVELLCLSSRNGMVSRGNLQAQVQESEDVQADFDSEDAPDEGDADPGPDMLNDKVSAKWDDIRQRLLVREKSFPGWPFELDGNTLRSKFDHDNDAHQLYATLLIASSMRLCHDKRAGEVSAAFEEIAYHWLRQSLNELWEVRPFGAHQTLPNAYTGTLYQKLQAFAADIEGVLLKNQNDYDPRDTGDGGIDVVAWQNMGDRRGNIPVIFGQCACSPTDWESKQLDVTPASTEAHIHPQHPGAAYCFIPHDLMQSDKQWQRESHVKRTIMVDRVRLLRLFDKLKSWSKLPKWEFVAEATQTNAVAAT